MANQTSESKIKELILDYYWLLEGNFHTSFVFKRMLNVLFQEEKEYVTV